MFLETLDVKSNDVVIFSLNKFDFKNNFWLVQKNSKSKIPNSINFIKVCEFVKNTVPKNLVVYRLLTNSKNVDAFSTKFGFFIDINSQMEVIYFDPIFALKDLNYLAFTDSIVNFRFKIQQIGLTSISKSSDEPSYKTVYSSDLRAYEAKYQNDKMFADAIFAFDEGYNDNIYAVEESGENLNLNFGTNKTISKVFTQESKIIEEKKKENVKLNKLNLSETEQPAVSREQKMNMLKKALGITDDDSKIKFPIAKQPLNLQKKKGEIKRQTNEQGLLGLFKSTEKPNMKEENFVLRISR